MSAKYYLINLTILVTAFMSMVGCDAIYDDEGDCTATYLVQFRYDMNMKFSDAFPYEVHAVTLYLLDTNNNIVSKIHDSGDRLDAEGYTMEVNVKPGTYNLIAWCSTNEKNSYTMTDDNSSINVSKTDSPLDELGCALNGPTTYVTTETSTNIDYELDMLYHGMLTNVTFPDKSGTHIVTVPLVKDTNRVRVVLQHVSGLPIDLEKFAFRIDADNAVLNYDNTVVTGHNAIYEPWHKMSASSDQATGGDVNISDSNTTTDNVINVAVAEITMSRLVVEDNPRLTVSNIETGEIIFSIPLKDYALMVKGYENSDMDDQEYLDRKDEYNMTFFLDEGDRWMDAFIYINSWKVILQNSSI